MMGDDGNTGGSDADDWSNGSPGKQVRSRVGEIAQGPPGKNVLHCYAHGGDPNPQASLGLGEISHVRNPMSPEEQFIPSIDVDGIMLIS